MYLYHKHHNFKNMKQHFALLIFILFLFQADAQNQAERIEDAFQTTISVNPSKVALSLRINDINKINDDRLEDFVSDAVNWAYGADHLENKLRQAYPNFIEGTVVFRNNFVPKQGEVVVFIDLDDYGPNVPFLFKDINNKHVTYKASVEITIDNE